VFTIPAITWAVTAVLLLGGSYHALRAIRSRHFADLVNESFHGLMHVLMAAMLWNLAPSTLLGQILILAGAALWFVIQAVARPEHKLLCAGTEGRLKCVYHSLTMVAAALMIATMNQPTTAGHGSSPASGMATHLPAAQHAVTAAAHNGATLDHSPALAILLTIFFGTATVIFLVLELCARYTKTTPRHTGASRLPNRPERGLDVLGAAVMAFMSATMAA